jgi:RNA polymerase sigma-70 factor (ECF subfamily)
LNLESLKQVISYGTQKRRNLENLTTRDLVLQMQQGSLDALGKLYDEHNRMVYRTALAILGDPEQAADLLQDVFLRLYRFADRIEPDRPLEPWLYRMTANLSYTWAKRRRWQQPLEDIAEWFSGDDGRQPTHQLEQDETARALDDAIQRLPDQQRIVVVMHYVNEASLEEIAAILDVPVGTVKSRLYYARKALKRRLDAKGGLSAEVQYEFT